MECLVGFNYYQLRDNIREECTWKHASLVNPHISVYGDTGSGKSAFLRYLCSELISTSNTRVHMMDVAGDMALPQSICSTVMFAETSGYGINPLEVYGDHIFGTPRRAIQDFIEAINRIYSVLGPQQESMLRALCVQLFEEFGMVVDDPSTWNSFGHVNRPATIPGDAIILNVPHEDFEIAIAAGASQDSITGLFFCYPENLDAIGMFKQMRFGYQGPSLDDLVDLARNRLRAMFLGIDDPTSKRISELRATMSTFNRRVKFLKRNFGKDYVESSGRDGKFQELREEALIRFEAFLSSDHEIENIDAHIDTSNSVVLQSLVARLENLRGTGIFKSNMPPHDPRKPCHRYKINAISDNEKRCFTEFVLRKLFSQSVRLGETTEIRHTIVLDEAAKFMTDDPDHIINIICREGRKYGVQLIMASQSPTHFSIDQIAASATKVILGLDKTNEKAAATKLGVDAISLGRIKPQESCLVIMKKKKESLAKPVLISLTPSIGTMARQREETMA